MSAWADDVPRDTARAALEAAEACTQDCNGLWQTALTAANAYAAQQATYATQDQDDTSEDASEAQQAYIWAQIAATNLGDPSLANTAKTSMQSAQTALATESEGDYPGSLEVEAAVQAVENGGAVDPALTQKINDMCGVTSGIGAPGCVTWNLRVGLALGAQAEQAALAGDLEQVKAIHEQCKTIGQDNCIGANGQSVLWDDLEQQANRFITGMEACPASANATQCIDDLIAECGANCPPEVLAQLNDTKNAIDRDIIMDAASQCTDAACVQALYDDYCSSTNDLCDANLEDALQSRKDVLTGILTPVYTTPPASACGQYTGYINKVVECITWHLDNAALSLMGAFYPVFNKFVKGMILLAVVLYGVLLALGSGRFSTKENLDGVGSQTIILLLKIGVIFFFIVNYQTVYGWAMDSKDGLLQLVNSSVNDIIEVSSSGASNECRTPDTIWKRLDCTIKRVIGFSTTQTEEGLSLNSNPNNMALVGGITGLMTALLFIPGIGIILFMIIVTFVLNLLLALARSVHIFLVSHMAIILLLLFAPLIVPMLLFQSTRSYFDAWARMLISYILQPVMLVAFLAMFAVALNVAIFSGENSFYKTLFKDLEIQSDTSTSAEGKLVLPACGNKELIASLQEAKCLDKDVYARDFISIEIDKSQTGILKEAAVISYDAFAQVSSFFGWKHDTSGEMIENYPIFADMPVEYLNMANCKKFLDDQCSGNLDEEPTAEQKKGGMQTLLAVMATLISMLLLVFVLSSLLEHIPALSAEIGGGAVSAMPFEQTLSGAVRMGASVVAKGVK